MRLEQCKTLEEKRLYVNKERIEEIERIRKLTQEEEPTEKEEYREPLSIETEIKKTVLLSWGGPSDGFYLYFDQEGNLLRGSYFIADWGEHQESQLTEEEAEEVFNFYMGGYIEIE